MSAFRLISALEAGNEDHFLAMSRLFGACSDNDADIALLQGRDH